MCVKMWSNEFGITPLSSGLLRMPNMRVGRQWRGEWSVSGEGGGVSVERGWGVSGEGGGASVERGVGHQWRGGWGVSGEGGGASVERRVGCQWRGGWGINGEEGGVSVERSMKSKHMFYFAPVPPAPLALSPSIVYVFPVPVWP